MWHEYKSDVIKRHLYVQPGTKSTEITGSVILDFVVARAMMRGQTST